MDGGNDLGGTAPRRCYDSPSQEVASPVVDLPDDLVYGGILARLPFRALLRAAVVCKAWRDLILRDPAFARAQARCPSPASAGLACYNRGCLEVVSPGAAAVAPPDASLSFLPVAGANLRLCSATSGLLCLITKAVEGDARATTIFVVNPATQAFRAVPYAGVGGSMACLAYDPSTVHRKGYHIVVPVHGTWELWRFRSFSSIGGGWRASRAEVRLAPSYNYVVSNPLYLRGRAHWLCGRGGVVWYDAGADAGGELPPPPTPSSLIAGHGGLEGSKELVTWHGRIGIALTGGGTGLALWALSSSSPARWEMVHRRTWDEIPGVGRSVPWFLWSVAPAGMEAGGEEALGLAVRIAHGPRRHTQQLDVVDGAGGEEKDVWRRELLRYDVRTGATAKVAELLGKEVHDDFGAVFSYHSSMAPQG